MSESFDKAVEAAARELFESERNTAMVEYPEWDSPKNVGKPLYIEDAKAAVTAALPHLTAEDVPHVIRQAKAEARAEGTRETAAYIERLYPAGLVNRADVLADMKIAEDRQSRGIHANGRDRASGIVYPILPPKHPTNPYAEEATNDHRT